MALNYSVTDDFAVVLKTGNKKIDQVGPFDSAEGANQWGKAICDKYNAPEFEGIEYPGDLPTENA